VIRRDDERSGGFRLQDLIHKNEMRIVDAIVRENGKTVTDAKGDVFRGLEVVEYASSVSSQLMGETLEGVSKNVDSYSFRQPIGVAAGVCPFNFPAVSAAMSRHAQIRFRAFLSLSRGPLTAFALFFLLTSGGAVPRRKMSPLFDFSFSFLSCLCPPRALLSAASLPLIDFFLSLC
jgi:hypothetical protein